MKSRVKFVKDFTKYGRSLLMSLLGHGVLLAFLLLGMDSGHLNSALTQKKIEIVEAVVVDEKQVDAEINRIKTEEHQQKLVDETHQTELNKKLEQLKQEQLAEQTKLEQIKRDMAKAKQEEQARLAEIKLAKEKEQKQLEALKLAKDKERKQLAALDDQHQAEQERVKQAQLEREKEEKKKEQLAKRKAEITKKESALKAAKEQERLSFENQQRIEGEVEKIKAEWAAKIKMNTRDIIGMTPDLVCKVAMLVLPDGSVQARVEQSSGNPLYDDVRLKAVYKSQPFRLPEDPEVREQVKSVELVFKNDEGVG